MADYEQHKKSKHRKEAENEGLGRSQTLTRAERLKDASREDKEGSKGFHGVKRGEDIESSRPRVSTPTRHHGNRGE